MDIVIMLLVLCSLPQSTTANNCRLPEKIDAATGTFDSWNCTFQLKETGKSFMSCTQYCFKSSPIQCLYFKYSTVRKECTICVLGFGVLDYVSVTPSPEPFFVRRSVGGSSSITGSCAFGPYGSSLGGHRMIFSSGENNQDISLIEVCQQMSYKYGLAFKELQFNGVPIPGTVGLNTEGFTNCHTLTFDRTEIITGIDIFEYDSLIMDIAFYTRVKKYGPFYGGPGIKYVSKGSNVRAFFGRRGWAFDQLGVLYDTC